ncbi:chorismate mutase [Cryptobacterium curtum]|uniref:chorismate mutase n=1 Tax=Cryptobacterium curtum TaxID=84163 RepID=UPI002355CA11|nr:chorismate mutase [Cryptobacterium curtum]
MPAQEDNVAKIEDHRAQIDAIDRQLVDLLNRRAEQSLAIRELKPGAHMGLFDPRREEEIFERVRSYNDGPLYDDNLREIYSAILKVMKEVPAR